MIIYNVHIERHMHVQKKSGPVGINQGPSDCQSDALLSELLSYDRAVAVFN